MIALAGDGQLVTTSGISWRESQGPSCGVLSSAHLAMRVALRCIWDKESGEIAEGQPPLEMKKGVTGQWNDAASKRLKVFTALCVVCKSII